MPRNSALRDLHTVLSNPLLEIAPALADQLRPIVGHSALVIFTEDCTGRPQKLAGDRAITDHVTVAEMVVVRESVRRSLRENAGGPAGAGAGAGAGAAGLVVWDAEGVIAGAPRAYAGWIAPSGALLVLTDPVLTDPVQTDPVPPRAATPEVAARDRAGDAVSALWNLVALSIHHQVAAASPAYLADSRHRSTERASIIAELTDTHSTTLETLLAVLRSPDATDSAARQTSVTIAASAMVTLRSVSDLDRKLSKEPVATAFERLKTDLRPLARFGGLDIQFIEPPVGGRALPGEVAHAGRAIVRGAVLALVEQTGVERVRVQWDCDGSNLLVTIRDDGPGDLTTDTSTVRQLSARVAALDGTLGVEATPGWGSEISVALPLDPVANRHGIAPAWDLTAQEKRVLGLAASGSRNRAIGEALSISENTVKFHVANVLRKVGASNRAELASIVNTQS
ncbi:MAG: LuxR family transcriptional regulator [Burkholderiaceae bacterium]|nr:LuxR family transcriptional regulator [Microbacteriaceae bacterium]